jgi:hypothetical protein
MCEAFLVPEADKCEDSTTSPFDNASSQILCHMAAANTFPRKFIRQMTFSAFFSHAVARIAHPFKVS